MILAAVRSGRSLFVTARSTKLEMPLSGTTVSTPAWPLWAACLAASAAWCPAMSTCTSPRPACAAVTVFSVASLRLPWSCSAMTSEFMSDHLGFVLQLGHQRGDVGHLDAGRACGWLAD